MQIPTRNVAQAELSSPVDQSWRNRPANVPQAFAPVTVSTSEVTLLEAHAKEFMLLRHVSVHQTSGAEHTLSFHVYESGGTLGTGNRIARPTILADGTLTLSTLEGYMLPAGHVLTAQTSAGSCNVSVSVNRVLTGV